MSSSSPPAPSGTVTTIGFNGPLESEATSEAEEKFMEANTTAYNDEDERPNSSEDNSC